MHIMLVNDDGIGAKGIMALLDAAAERGHRVSMCAPRYQQSAASHRFTLAEPLYSADYPLPYPNCKGFSIVGSPADCVRIGMQQLDAPVDVVISGINNGYNAGIAVHYSGTVGAAMEGAFHGLPAIATSIHHEATESMIRHLARYTIETAERYVKLQTPRCSVLNINAPCVEPEQLKPPVYAPLDTAYFLDGYERRESPRAGTYFWLEGGSEIEPCDPGSDNDYLEQGHITLTLIGNFISHDAALLKGLNG